MESAGSRPLQASVLGALLVAARPRQWLKNLFVFAGILFAAKLGDAGRWVDAFACFAAFCLASSAAYLVNDVRDAAEDRLHPVKRDRPVAAGTLSPGLATGVAAGLAVAALLVAAPLGLRVAGMVVAFLALQAGYSLGVKHIAPLDVLAIAGLFVIRAAAGAEAVSVEISWWLLLCTALLALFLGLAKRRGELVLVGAARTPGRRVLEGYSIRLVDRLVSVVATATLLAYAAYTLTARDSKAMAVTIPFVLFAVGRYLVLVHRDDLGEEPDRVLLSDAQLLVAVAAWAVTAAVVLSVTQ